MTVMAIGTGGIIVYVQNGINAKHRVDLETTVMALLVFG